MLHAPQKGYPEFESCGHLVDKLVPHVEKAIKVVEADHLLAL